MSADPIDPGRIVLFDRWADQTSLDAHLAAMGSAPPPSGPTGAPTSATITIYDVAGERPLGVRTPSAPRCHAPGRLTLS